MCKNGTLLYSQYVMDFKYNGKDAELYLSNMTVGEKNNNYNLVVMKDTKVRRGRGWGNPLFLSSFLLAGRQIYLQCSHVRMEECYSTL